MEPQTETNGNDRNRIVLSVGESRATIIPEKGGRITELSHQGTNALYSLYPESFAFGPYTEYGGIEEHVGSAPGTVWNAAWETTRGNGAVSMAAYSNKTLVQKTVSLAGDPPALKVEYTLSNYSTNFARFTFGIHPELSLGDFRKVQYHVPLEGHVESGTYTGAGFRKYLIPELGWSAVTSDGKLFAQMLPKGVIDCLEVYYPKVDTHLVLQPVVFGVGISPGKACRFSYLAYYGPGDAAYAQELYDQWLPEMKNEYVVAAPQPESPAPPRREVQHDGHFGFEGGVEAVLKNVGNVIENLPNIPNFDWGGGRRGREHREPREPRPPRPPEPPRAPRPAHGEHMGHPFRNEPGRDRKEERLMVLKQVSEGRITVEEAALLLEKLNA